MKKTNHCFLVLVFRQSKGLDISSDDKDAYLKGRSKKEKNQLDKSIRNARQICKRQNCKKKIIAQKMIIRDKKNVAFGIILPFLGFKAVQKMKSKK